jgi:hypothetical protein
MENALNLSAIILRIRIIAISLNTSSDADGTGGVFIIIPDYYWRGGKI